MCAAGAGPGAECRSAAADRARAAEPHTDSAPRPSQGRGAGPPHKAELIFVAALRAATRTGSQTGENGGA